MYKYKLITNTDEYEKEIKGTIAYRLGLILFGAMVTNAISMLLAVHGLIVHPLYPTHVVETWDGFNICIAVGTLAVYAALIYVYHFQLSAFIPERVRAKWWDTLVILLALVGSYIAFYFQHTQYILAAILLILYRIRIHYIREALEKLDTFVVSIEVYDTYLSFSNNNANRHICGKIRSSLIREMGAAELKPFADKLDRFKNGNLLRDDVEWGLFRMIRKASGAEDDPQHEDLELGADAGKEIGINNRIESYIDKIKLKLDKYSRYFHETGPWRLNLNIAIALLIIFQIAITLISSDNLRHFIYFISMIILFLLFWYGSVDSYRDKKLRARNKIGDDRNSFSKLSISSYREELDLLLKGFYFIVKPMR